MTSAYTTTGTVRRTSTEIVSRHFLRRRARERAVQFNRKARAGALDADYFVEKARRGPYRWFVVKEVGL